MMGARPHANLHSFAWKVIGIFGAKLSWVLHPEATHSVWMQVKATSRRANSLRWR